MPVHHTGTEAPEIKLILQMKAAERKVGRRVPAAAFHGFDVRIPSSRRRTRRPTSYFKHTHERQEMRRDAAVAANIGQFWGRNSASTRLLVRCREIPALLFMERKNLKIGTYFMSQPFKFTPLAPSA